MSITARLETLIDELRAVRLELNDCGRGDGNIACDVRKYITLAICDLKKAADAGIRPDKE